MILKVEVQAILRPVYNTRQFMQQLTGQYL